jgi:hypothetical protein
MNLVYVNQICIINFAQILDIIIKNFLNTAYEYDLFNKNHIPHINLKNTDNKRILKHSTIHTICEEYKKIEYPGKRVIVVPEIYNLQYTDIYDTEEIYKEICKNIKQVKQKLPIIFYFLNSQVDIKKLQNKYFWDEGEGRDIRFFLEKTCNSFDFRSISFQNIKNYVKKNKLNFLSREYFNTIESKKILYK